MDTATFMAFVTYALIMSFTPGPNNILALSCAGQFGLQKSAWLITGISSGFVAVMLLCGLCSLTLASILPNVVPWLTWFGAAYILWLAWHIATAETGTQNSATQPPRFVTGFLLQFINVKVVLCGVTAMTAFVLPSTREPLHILGYSMILALIGATGTWVWGLMGNMLQTLFQRYGRKLNIVLGLSLVYCVVRMFE